ncbi:MAG: sugar phosphate isomerase/epimerase [Kiritimatiellia bacterium]|jgi:sugar phosphate isomerase/epimerase
MISFSPMSIKLHNAMWPGLVGKGEPDTEPAISMEHMLELTAAAEVNGQKFDGVDLFLLQPHFDFDGSEDDIRRTADLIAAHGFNVGSLVAPVWPGTVGDSAMGNDEQRAAYLKAITGACRAGKILREHGVRSYGAIRIDSATSPEAWAKDPVAGTKRIAETFGEAAKIAEAHGERLAAEGEICWAGMHSWKYMQELLEAVGRPDVVGFQADLAHTYLYLLGANAPEHALLSEGHSDEEFWAAYKTMTDALAPWTFDFHVAQSNGTVFGSGSHDKTGRHCPADAADGKLDIVKCARQWLLDADGNIRNNIEHLCWDGCMFPNDMLENPATWNNILDVMLQVKADITS